jgi:hypothetical protein
MDAVKDIKTHICMYNKSILFSVNFAFGSAMNVKVCLKWGMLKTYDSNPTW